MAAYYFFSSVTRNSDLWQQPFEVQPWPRDQWATGDFVVGRVIGERNRLYRCETKTGRMAEMVRGDLLVGAFGLRAATLEGVGDWHEIGEDLEMDALTGAGLMGKATSTSPMLPNLMHLKYQGHVVRDGRKLNMGDFVQRIEPVPLEMPVVLVIGTSMSSGKTSAARVIIRALTYIGQEVVAAKLTGAARYADVLSFRDSGAREVFDFVDTGLPSTVCEPDLYRDALGQLLTRVQMTGAGVLVAEAGASPLEPYNGSVAIEAIGGLIRFTVLCASDPYAVLGVQTAFGQRPDLVAGPAANTDAAIALVDKLAGVRAMNLLDRKCYPVLKDLLAERLGVDNATAQHRIVG
ncbi:MAG: hypothetical protein WBN65_08080 [Gammaproteobacteria bacterium]